MRVRHWITYHGVALNVEPDLSHFAGIVPCGIADHGVTSLVDLGLPVTLADVDVALARRLRGDLRRSRPPDSSNADQDGAKLRAKIDDTRKTPGA